MPPYAYLKNQFVPLEEAKIGVMTHAFLYGTGCFEGIRGNWNADERQIYLFRAREHYERLHQSSRLLKIKLKHSVQDLCNITTELIERGDFQQDIYVRPIAYKSSEIAGNLRLHELEDDLLVFVIPFGNYLDPNKGIHCQVSSWRRLDDNVLPSRAKITGGYVNSVLAKTEAIESGFDEAIMLTDDGHVSEGSGENVFLVQGGKLITPAVSDNILVGITRSSVMELAKNELGVETVERSIDRTELYLADECFLTGTAAHLTPVTRVDHRPVGSGQVGPITKKLQGLYFDVVRGKVKKYQGWCLPAYAKVKAKA